MFSAQRKLFLRFQLFLSSSGDVMVGQKTFHMKLNLKVDRVELISSLAPLSVLHSAVPRDFLLKVFW